MVVEEKPSEISVSIRTDIEVPEMCGFMDVSIKDGIRASYGVSANGTLALQKYHFNRADGWTKHRVQTKLKEFGVQLSSKKGKESIELSADFVKNEQVLFKDCQVGLMKGKRFRGSPYRWMDVVQQLTKEPADEAETEIVFMGDSLREGLSVGDVKLGVIGNRNSRLENKLRDRLPEGLRQRVKFVSLKDDNVPHVSILKVRSGIISDMKIVGENVENATFSECVAHKEAAGHSHEKAIEICKAIAANGGVENTKLLDLIPAEVVAIKSLATNEGEQFQYLVGIRTSTGLVPLGTTNSSKYKFAHSQPITLSYQIVDAHKDSKSKQLWLEGHGMDIVEAVSLEDGDDAVERLYWQGHNVPAPYPKAFEERAKVGIFSNEWENHLYMSRNRMDFMELKAENDVDNNFDIQNMKVPHNEWAKGRWVSHLHEGTDEYPTHMDLRLETDNGVLSWAVWNGGVECKCPNTPCRVSPKPKQTKEWLGDAPDNEHTKLGTGKYEMGVQSDTIHEFFLSGDVEKHIVFKKIGDAWFNICNEAVKDAKDANPAK